MPAAWLRRPALWLACAWIVAALYVGTRLDRGWVPHDEGAIAHSAERVLAGELPHRDFDEIYTGGLSFLNAVAFRVVGVTLRAPRLVMFGFFLAWVPAVFYVASRFAPPPTAALATLLAVAWSVPNYSAAVPSWYNLFFATLGTAALLHYLESERRRWLVAAGVAGGLSCVAKVTGLYFIAGALLFLLYRERVTAQRAAHDAPGARRVTAYRLVTMGGLALLVVVLALLVRSQPGGLQILHFVLPGAAVAALLVWHEWSGPPGADRDRFAGLVRLGAPFALGVAAPVALFVLPYVATGALGELITGVFVAPTRRLAFASMDFVDPLDAAAVYPIAALGALAVPGNQAGRWIRLAGGLVLVGLLVGPYADTGYSATWSSMRPLVPAVVIAGVALLAVKRLAHRLGEVRRQQVMLLLAVTALCSLVQFPFSAPIYFLYVAPLAALAGLAVWVSFTHRAESDRHSTLTAALLFYAAFAVLRLHPGFIYGMGHHYLPEDLTHRLALDRGGLAVSTSDSATYSALVDALGRHAGGTRFTYATPDCPEVYFLSGLGNPTRTLFDFFDPPAGRVERVTAALERHDVRTVVINRRPAFSGPGAAELAPGLAARFPAADTIGRFIVRWRP